MNNIEIKLNKEKGEIKSIKFKGIELIHQPDNFWDKSFPVIFPQLSSSTGWSYKEKKFLMPRHGFWKDLKWSIKNFDKTYFLESNTNNIEDYPFKIEIKNEIVVFENIINFTYSFKNIGKNKVFFHFGLHPAFLIDENTKFNKVFEAEKINLQGWNIKENVLVDEKLLKMPFGIDYDTLVVKNVQKKFSKLSYEYQNIIVEIFFDSPNLQIWRPKKSNFICIEPWYGENDLEMKTFNEVSKKPSIIDLDSKSIYKVNFQIKIK
ncbi:MAG: hypothetical protein K4H23_04680, partial [Mollicutes bacterium PWAP]|nr:hypothetical protein [Mollicutes bacterium PWAP]